MSWRRLGQIYKCEPDNGWRASHAYVPTACLLADRVRVFVAFRDSGGVGRLGFVDLDPADPTRVIGVSPQPVLDVGPIGAFDDSGVTPLSVVRKNKDLWLYYAGWHRSVTARYHLFTGLAISRDDGLEFIRHGNVPVLDRTEQAWLIRSGVSVLRVGRTWKCWCATSSRLVDVRGKLIPAYDWSYLESHDGIHWPKSHRVVLPAAIQDDILGYGRSHVVSEGGTYHAWISVRTLSGGYRIAHSQSSDGKEWAPLDYTHGLLPGGDGFDSQEVCFPSIFDLNHRRYVLYNGNDFGRTGFGLAIWEED